MRGNVVSDIHMMSRSSESHRHWPRILDAAKHSDFFVINGDLNELFFTRLPFEQRMETALTNLETLVRSNPACEFHYVLGNHEAVDAFMIAVVALAHKLPNLAVHDSFYRKGNALFLHGDQLLRGGEVEPRKLVTPEKSHVPSIIMPFVDRYQHGFRKLRQKIHYRNDGDIAMLLDGLGKSSPMVRDGVDYVFYAHTHHPKFAIRNNDSGKTFFNGGAGVKGAEFNLLSVEMDDKEHVLSVRQMLPEREGRSYRSPKA